MLNHQQTIKKGEKKKQTTRTGYSRSTIIRTLNKMNKKNKIVNLQQFIKESIPTLFHIPFPPMIGKKITKMMELATNANRIDSKKDEILVLFQDPSAFKSNIYISGYENVPGANNVQIPGTFMAKVYDDPYNAIPEFVKDMNAYLEKEGKKIQKMMSTTSITLIVQNARRNTGTTT